MTPSAYVQPVIDGYIARFSDRLGREGFKGRFAGPMHPAWTVSSKETGWLRPGATCPLRSVSAGRA